MSSASALEELLHSPRLPEYAELIRQRLADEQIRRERFYSEMTDELKTEFISGEVIMHSPARNRHLVASGHLFVLLHSWVSSSRIGLVHVEKALCVFNRNDYEPDIVYFGSDKAQQITPDTLRFPVPDFIVEIVSNSTEERDRGVKFEDYAAHGVREYWIVDPIEESLEQYILTEAGQYKLKMKSQSGEASSIVITGFAIPIRAIFDADVNQIVLAAMLGSRRPSP